MDIQWRRALQIKRFVSESFWKISERFKKKTLKLLGFELLTFWIGAVKVTTALRRRCKALGSVTTCALPSVYRKVDALMIFFCANLLKARIVGSRIDSNMIWQVLTTFGCKIKRSSAKFYLWMTKSSENGSSVTSRSSNQKISGRNI